MHASLNSTAGLHVFLSRMATMVLLICAPKLRLLSWYIAFLIAYTSPFRAWTIYFAGIRSFSKSTFQHASRQLQTPLRYCGIFAGTATESLGFRPIAAMLAGARRIKGFRKRA